MNQLRQQNKKSEATQMKRYWKLLLKNRRHINCSTYSNWKSFPSSKFPMLTEAMVIDRLLAYSDEFKTTYSLFHDIQEAFREKDHFLFFELLQSIPEDIDKQFRKKLRNLLKYKEGIKNALIYSYSS